MATRLLVVDDDEMNRDVLSRRLARKGYDTVIAESGPEALAILDSQHIDLVLLDVMMPGMSGIEALQRIRQKFSAIQLPVIMVTAVAESDGIVEAMRMGANDYVTKPLNYPVVMARIETRLSLATISREMQVATELYRLASSASDEGLWDWDIANGKLFCSARWKSILGYPEDEIQCGLEEWTGQIHPRDRERWHRELKAHIQGQTASLECEFRMRHKNGSYVWVEFRAGASRDAAGVATRVAGHLTDVTTKRTVDQATLLPNRVWLEGELEGFPESPSATALVLLELDGFNRYRESLSQEQSRLMLQAVVSRLRSALQNLHPDKRTELTASGEHQFGVLVRQSDSPEELQQLARSLQTSLDEPFGPEGEASFLSASVGIAMVPADEPLTTLLRDAQAALRHAREHGASDATVFQQSMRQHDLEEIRLESDLRRAVERREFLVHYQPKVDLEDGSIAGFEALVRWNRPGFGLVPPNDFIPLAERNGLIVPLGIFVLERACEDTAQLRRSFPKAEVSVNVSGRQFADPLLVDHVRRVLETTALDPGALRLEVTETVVINDAAKALETMRQFRKLGVGLKLDDFGAGYSSLAYLQQFPFDTLKIDRSFVTGMGNSPEGLAIVRAIVEMARFLHLFVVAEGIENWEQAELLHSLGCRYGQGYLFSRPVELARLRELLATWKMPGLPVMSMAAPGAARALPA
jgi:PAS domain S-box-containing protein